MSPLSVVGWLVVVLVIGVVLYFLVWLQRQIENLLVVGDLLRKGPPSVKAPQKSLDTHGIGTSRNTMENQRGSFDLRDAPEGRTAMFIRRFE
jgi:cell division septal protein FtsQ